MNDRVVPPTEGYFGLNSEGYRTVPFPVSEQDDVRLWAQVPRWWLIDALWTRMEVNTDLRGRSFGRVGWRKLSYYPWSFWLGSCWKWFPTCGVLSGKWLTWVAATQFEHGGSTRILRYLFLGKLDAGQPFHCVEWVPAGCFRDTWMLSSASDCFTTLLTQQSLSSSTISVALNLHSGRLTYLVGDLDFFFVFPHVANWNHQPAINFGSPHLGDQPGFRAGSESCC